MAQRCGEELPDLWVAFVPSLAATPLLPASSFAFREMLLQYRSQALSIALERRIAPFPCLFLKHRSGFLVVLDHVFNKLPIELGAAEASSFCFGCFCSAVSVG
jgi:hypothetical protein